MFVGADIQKWYLHQVHFGTFRCLKHPSLLLVVVYKLDDFGEKEPK